MRSRDRRSRTADRFDPDALALLTLGPQGALLREWLKNDAQTRSWDSLLKAALKAGGTRGVELAELLAEALVACGAASLDERFERATWLPVALTWRDYEQVCTTLGIKTRAAKRNTFAAAWDAARQVRWHDSALAEALQTLPDMPADRGRTRLDLLLSLNDWLGEGKSGTRREFEIHARGRTKALTRAEWAWLEEVADLTECGIERHAPAFWIAGNVELLIGQRWLDVGAAGDFMALTPLTMSKLMAGKTGATHYRLIENRTSFENVAREAVAAAEDIVIWLPGYMPDWWRVAAGKLIDALPLPARISCDADPDGVRIALQASALWTARGLAWEPRSMAMEDAAGSRHKLPLTEHDLRLADSLLNQSDLPASLQTLLQWCIDHQCKAEQENWL